MNNRILEIRSYNSPGGSITFAGTLRNGRKFELFQKVFIESNGAMYQCKVVGIELPPESNPDYIYKIELPEELIEKRQGESFIPDNEKDRISLTCKHIFSSIDEAKSSAYEYIQRKYVMQKEEIERFFKLHE